MSFTKVAKTITVSTKSALTAVIGYLLNEDGSFLLQENGRKIVLDRDWSEQSKSASGFTAGSGKTISGFTVVPKG
jgi:ascorbate-specific PTS system EIIC-type component UlaA